MWEQDRKRKLWKLTTATKPKEENKMSRKWHSVRLSFPWILEAGERRWERRRRSCASPRNTGPCTLGRARWRKQTAWVTYSRHRYDLKDSQQLSDTSPTRIARLKGRWHLMYWLNTFYLPWIVCLEVYFFIRNNLAGVMVLLKRNLARSMLPRVMLLRFSVENNMCDFFLFFSNLIEMHFYRQCLSIMNVLTLHSF